MASPPNLHSLSHGKSGLTLRKFCRQTTFKEGKGGGVAFFLSLHQHDLFLYGGCYKDYENSRKCSSTEAAPHLTLPTFPTSDTHLFTAIHQKHWSPKYPILSFLAPLVRTSWISHHGQHNLFFFWLRPLQSFSSMHVGLWWASKIFEGVLKENIKSS